LTTGEVRLEVPATPEFLRITRIMMAGVASRLGFTLDEVEDLRIAIDELCFALVGKGRAGTIALRYEMLDDGLAVEGAGHFTDDGPAAARLSPMSNQILGAMVDEVSLGTGADGGPTFRMIKRRRPV